MTVEIDRCTWVHMVCSVLRTSTPMIIHGFSRLHVGFPLWFCPCGQLQQITGAEELGQRKWQFAWGSQHWLRALVAQRFEFGLEDVDLWSKSLLVDALLMTIWKWLGSVDGSTFETNRKHLVLYGVYCIYKQQWGKQVRPAINRSSLRVWGPKLPGLGDHCFPFLGYNVAGPPKL